MTTPRSSVSFILSGDYCSQELSAEFGRLPPCMLPADSRRLYEAQIAFLRRNSDRICITLPSDYVLPAFDAERLSELNVEVIRTPSSFNLSQAAYFALGSAGATGQVDILLGDTLILHDEDIPSDSISVNVTSDYYYWSVVEGGEGRDLSVRKCYGNGISSREVLTGYYKLSDAEEFRHNLGLSDSFDSAIEKYSSRNSIKLMRGSVWLDFGHLNRFYHSKRDLLTSRSFNSVRCEGFSLIKESANGSKMRAEANWFMNLPDAIKIYTPHFLGERVRDGVSGYALEYLHHSTLADLFVFGELPAHFWRKTLLGCFDFLEACAAVPVSMDDDDRARFASEWYDSIIVEKTRERLKAFAEREGFDLKHPLTVNGSQLPGLQDMAEHLISLIPTTRPDQVGLCHGDFFFGNTMLDQRSGIVKVIDPRGMLEDGKLSLYGDRRYDQAKLLHSVYGRYDSIIAGRYRLDDISTYETSISFDGNVEIDEAQRFLLERELFGTGFGSREVRAMTILLFISMLPLHGDNKVRQRALLSNAARLYAEMLEQDRT